MPRIPVLFLVTILALLWTARPAQAQPTHVQQLQELGIRCLGNVPGNLGSFRLDGDESAPYLPSALFSYWSDNDRQVFDNDTLRTDVRLPVLFYRLENVGIDLKRAKSGGILRTASLGVRYRLSGPGGQILADNQCSDSLTDTLSVERARAYADPRYSETNIEPPQGGWFRSVLEPAVIAGAAAIGAYLFFNLRSRRTNDR